MVDSGHGAGEGSAVERVVEELRTLRRAQVRTSYDFKRTPTLLWHLGRGNVDVAATFFRHLAGMGNLYIDAAIASLGFGPDIVNVEDRMSQFALREGAESTRTVRRWTDQGFRLIAEMVLDWSAEEGHDRPLIEVVAHPGDSDEVLLEVSCIMASGMKMFTPEIRTTSGVVPWSEGPLERSQLAPPVVFKARAAVDFSSGDGDGRIVEVVWLGQAEAYYEVNVFPGIMQQYKLRVITTKKGCELHWQLPIHPSDAISL